MDPRSGNGSGGARVALVGATTNDGARLREALADFGVHGSRVDLYCTVGEEAVISEYDGEARLIQPADLREILDHDVVFLCQRGTLSDQVAEAIGNDSFLIDVGGALDEAHEPQLVHLGINPDAADEHHRPLAVPHPLSIVLVELLHALDRRLGLEEATAVVLRPAADFGEAGVEELREQTVGLLNLGEVPVKTFGRQLAFNILPAPSTAGAGESVASRVTQDVERLLGRSERRFSMRLMTAPIFYGHCLQLRFRVSNGAALAEVREALGDGVSVGAGDSGALSTPLDVSGERRTCVADVSEDGLGGFWLWAVAGKTRLLAAQQAVRLADRLAGLRE